MASGERGAADQTAATMPPLQRWLIARVQDGIDANNMIQREVAALAGISEKHLSRVLNGRDQGTLAMWSRLLSAAGCPLNTDAAEDATRVRA